MPRHADFLLPLYAADEIRRLSRTSMLMIISIEIITPIFLRH